MVTIMINGVFPSSARLIDKSIRKLATKVMIADYSENGELQCLFIVCEYELLVEVIRRIHSICVCTCDFVDIVIK